MRKFQSFSKLFFSYYELSEAQLHKIGQSGGIFGRLLGPLLKPRFTLIET